MIDMDSESPGLSSVLLSDDRRPGMARSTGRWNLKTRTEQPGFPK